MAGKKVSIMIVVMILFVATSASAQSNIYLKGIGGSLGFVSPEDPIESTIGFGAVADLGTITQDIRLGASLGFWSKSYEAGTGFGSSAEWTFSEIIIQGLGKYYFQMEDSQFFPYAGGGIGFTISRTKWESSVQIQGYESSDSDSDSEIDIGFSIFAGADYPLSPTLTGFAEFRYHINGADFWGIFAGVVYNLGKSE